MLPQKSGWVFSFVVSCILSPLPSIAHATDKQTNPLGLATRLALEIEGPLPRAQALLEIAHAQILADDRTAALATLEKTLAELEAISGETKELAGVEALTNAAGLFAKAGDTDRAIEVARSMRASRTRIALGKIGYRLAVEGHTDAALQVAKADASHRRHVLNRIILGVASAGRVSEALAVVQERKDPSSWDQQRESIVRVTTRKAVNTKSPQLLDEASRVLSEFDAVYPRLEAKVEIGKAAAQLGDKERCLILFRDALSTIAAEDHYVWNATLSTEIAEGLLMVGERDAAFSALAFAVNHAGKISYQPSRSRVVVRTLRDASSVLAGQQCTQESMEYLERAIQAIRKIERPEERATAFSDLAALCVELRSLELLERVFREALQAAEEARDHEPLERGLKRELVIARAQLGDYSGAMGLAQQLEPKTQSSCFFSIARILVDEGRDEEAMDAVAQIEGIDHRNLAMANLASTLGSKRRLNSALEVVRQIADPQAKDRARELCAFSLARAGDAEAAVAVGLQIQDESTLHLVFNRLAVRIAAKGDVEAATLLLKEHQGLIEQYALANCVRLLASVGDVSQALDSVRQCGNPTCRSQALFYVALMLATEPLAQGHESTEIAARKMRDTFAAAEDSLVEQLVSIAGQK